MTVFDDLVAAANPYLIERNIAKIQGGSWEVRQTLQVNDVPMDWTGCTASCQIKKSDGTLVFTFTTLALTAGLLTMTATPTQTASLVVGLYYYDVDIVNGSSRRLAFMSGNFRIAKQVTA